MNPYAFPGYVPVQQIEDLYTAFLIVAWTYLGFVFVGPFLFYLIRLCLYVYGQNRLKGESDGK